MDSVPLGDVWITLDPSDKKGIKLLIELIDHIAEQGIKKQKLP